MKNSFFSENRLIGFSQETNPQPKILKQDPFEDKKEKADGKTETKETAEAPDRSKEINETVTKLGVKLEKMKAMATKMPPELAEKWETFVNARITEINVNANVDQEAAMKAIEKCSHELEKVLSHETASVEVVRNGESVTVTAPSIPGKIPTNFCVVGGIPQCASITADGRQQWTVPSVLPTATATVTYMDCKTGALMQIPIFIGKSGSMKLDAINPAQAKVKTTPMPNAYEEAVPKAEKPEIKGETTPIDYGEAGMEIPEAQEKKKQIARNALKDLQSMIATGNVEQAKSEGAAALNKALNEQSKSDRDDLIIELKLRDGVQAANAIEGAEQKVLIQYDPTKGSVVVKEYMQKIFKGRKLTPREGDLEIPKTKPKSAPEKPVDDLRALKNSTMNAARLIKQIEQEYQRQNSPYATPELVERMKNALRAYNDAAEKEIQSLKAAKDGKKDPARISELETDVKWKEARLLVLNVMGTQVLKAELVKNTPPAQTNNSVAGQKEVAMADVTKPKGMAKAPAAVAADVRKKAKGDVKATPTSTVTPESPAAEPVGPAAKKDLAKKTDALKQDAEKKVEALKEAPNTKGEALERQMDSALKKLGEAKTDTQKFAAFMELLATVIEFIRAAFKGELSQEYNKDGQKGKESKEKEKSKNAYARVAKEVGENKEKKPLTEKLKNLETKKDADLAKTKLDLTKNENDTKTLKEKGVTLGNQKTVLEGELKKIDSKDPKAAEERTRLTAEIQKLTDLMKSNQEAVVASEKRHTELVKKKTELIEDGMVLREMNEKVGPVLAKLQAGINLLKGKNGEDEFDSYELKMSSEGGFIVSFENPAAGFQQKLEEAGGKLNGSAVEIDSEKLASMQALAGNPTGTANPAERPEDKIEPPKNPESLDMGEIAKVLKDTWGVLNGKIERTQANLKDAEKDLKEAQASWNMFRKSWFSDEVKAKQADVDQSKAALTKLNQHKARISPFFDEKGEARQNITKEQLEAISDVRTKLGLPALPRNMVADYDAFQKEALVKFAGRDKKLEVNYQEINEMLKQTDAFLGDIETGIRTVDTAAAIGSSFAGPWGSFVYSGIRNMGDYVSGAKTAEQALFDTGMMVVAGKLGGAVAGGAGKLAAPVRNAIAVWAKKNAPMLTKGVAKTIVEYGGKATTGAIAGGTMSGFDAGTRNIGAYSRGEKTGEQAFEDTYNSAKTGVVTGAVLGGTLPAVGKAWNKGKAWRAEAKAAKTNNADPSKAPGFKIQGEAPPPAGSPTPSSKPSQARLKAQEKQLVRRLKEEGVNPKEQTELNNKLFEVRQQLGSNQVPQGPSLARKAGRAYGKARNTVNKGREAVNAFGEKVKEKFRRGEKPAEATAQPKKVGPIARLKENISARGQKLVNDLKPKPILSADGVKYQRGETVTTPQGEVVRVRSYNRSTGQMNIEINGRAVSVNPKNYEKIRTNGDIPQKLRDQLKGVEAKNAPKAAPETKQQKIDRFIREEEALAKNLGLPPQSKAQMRFEATQKADRAEFLEKFPFSQKLDNKFDELMRKNFAPGYTYDLKHSLDHMVSTAQAKNYNGWREQFSSMEQGLKGRISAGDQQTLQNLKAELLKICPPPKASVGSSNTAKAKPAAAPTALPNQQGTSFTLGNGINLTVAVKNNPPLPLPPGNYQIKSVNPGNGTAVVYRNGSPEDLHTVNLNELNAIPKTQPPPANATSKSPSAPTKLKVPLRLEYRAALTDPSSNIQKTRISMDGYLRTETHPDTLLLKKHLPTLKARSTELEKATATPDPKGGVERAGLEMERDFLRSLLPRMEKIINEKGSSYAA